MENFNNMSKKVYKNKSINYKTVKVNFMEALNDPSFVKLVNSLDASEEVLMKYTTKLESSVCELKNCKGCKGLGHCKNKITGYLNYPSVQNEGLVFNYIPCKYEKENEKNKTKVTYFEVPKFIYEAKMSDIIVEKERLDLIKYLKKFIDNFYTDKKEKGLYLCGSFGSGKSYILSAVINEISKGGAKAVIVYYPNLLSNLKASFNSEDYDIKLESIMKSDILLIDDIGAENNTSWSRDEVLGTILQYRMDNKLTTFFTSNLNLDELESHLKITNNSSDSVKSRRIIERIKWLTNYMELISENKRK